MSWIDFIKKIIEPKEFNVRFLETIDKSRWPAIYCSLNGWEIPKELESIKPDWWDGEEDLYKMSPFVRPLIERIQQSINPKVLSREWNKERMTDEQFELWWQHKDDDNYFDYWMPKIFPERKYSV